MFEWSVDFTIEAEEDLEKLDKGIKGRVLEKIKWLRVNFDRTHPLPLGYGWRGFFKLRVGDWRIVYEIDYSEKEISIHRIDHRDKVYKRIK